MIQYGDIRDLDGHTLEPVDLIVGGSPCQNLSIAGNRQGLEGSESGLFLEMIRIIREMRERTNGVYPRYALFENVPGLFTCNDGRDFSVVLGEYARLIEPSAPDVPVPQMGWKKAGVLLVGDGQIAYRTHQAQLWGLPQYRERIALIVSFGDQSAAEILFERKDMPENLESKSTQKDENARNSGKSIESTDTVKQYVFDSQPYHDYREMSDICQSISAQYGTGGNNMPFVVTDDGMFHVRKLTPLEATRLQGYPDEWLDIPGASDSKKFKALGNSLCLPFWEHLAYRFAQYGNVRTIGSLFDGIGGFPLVFKRAGCKTLWVSEIEPFCQRVVAYHTERGDL